jgi:transcriptional regulator with PAS, ATPase and Fis domain
VTEDHLHDLEWAREFPGAITVTDRAGVIIYMNHRSCETFAADGGAALVGSSVYACHPEPSRSRLRALMEAGESNHYTIRKNGRRKIIHQVPWYREGAFAGLVELSLEIPEAMPHFDRDTPA